MSHPRNTERGSPSSEHSRTPTAGQTATGVRIRLHSRTLLAAGFVHGFSLRTGRVSGPPFSTLNLGRAVGDSPEHVEENQRRFARAVGYAPGELFELSQVHGRRVRRVGPEELSARVRSEQGDALVAAAPGLAVGVRTADCLPLLLADTHSGAVVAVHVGWRGLVSGVIHAACRELEHAGGVGDHVLAVTFPHLRRCCFEIGPDVAERIADSAPGSDVIEPARPGRPRPHADLAGATSSQLLRAGITRVEDVPGCTRCEPGRFFSYRREGPRSGRHLTVIVARGRASLPFA